MKFQKVADLKRIAVGTKLVLVDCLMGPCRKERTVAQVKSNAILFSVPGKESLSWLYFPKASEFQPTEKGFRIMEGEEIGAEYEVSDV